MHKDQNKEAGENEIVAYISVFFLVLLYIDYYNTKIKWNPRK